MRTAIDNERSIYWFTLAAKQGHRIALYNLGLAYKKGIGVKQNVVKATELIEKAAELGYSSAQLTFGDMYRDGEVFIGRVVTDSVKGKALIIGLKPDIRLAKEWWTKALKNSDEDVREWARERLEQVYE